MIINKCTFTGADNSTSVEEMLSIQKEYPFVEWGILIASNPGRNRYPSNDYIMSLKDKGLNLALHLCSIHTKGIMTDGILDIKYDFFERYQINFNFKHSSHDLANYAKLIKKFPNKKFILQSNFSNESYIDTILEDIDTKNTNILFDSSGGRGTEIKLIKDPYKGIYTGYSGGLNPDNVKGICNLITEHKSDDKVWIDMESGVRTDDIFDLNKVRSVLKIVKSCMHRGFTI
jgi:hypothetical protein